MKKGMIIGLFCAVALIQVATPLSMIAKRESVLRVGEQFKFKTAPVDPYDAFRGRYVALAIVKNTAPVPAGVKFDYGDRVYALISVDQEGFANFSEARAVRPKNGAYIEAEVDNIYPNEVLLGLPIDRYYMEEEAAPAAERLYQEHASRDRQDAYILVRVKDGLAVIEALYVGDKPIEEALKSFNE